MDLNLLTVSDLFELGTLCLFGFLGVVELILKKHSGNDKNTLHAYLHLMKWLLRIVLIGIVSKVGVHIADGSFPQQTQTYHEWAADFVIFMIVLLFCFFTINRYIQQVISDNQLTTEQPSLAEQSPVDLNATKEESVLIGKLEEYMKEEQPYLQPKIKIADLAEDLEEKPHVLSKLINKHYGYNFFHFINQYRVKHATKLLTAVENRQYTIEGIGQHCGFNSRTTFNMRFKELTGVSPGAFQKSRQNWVSQEVTFGTSEVNN